MLNWSKRIERVQFGKSFLKFLARRANFDNLEEYVYIGEDYAKDLEELMNNGKKEVLKEKGLSEEYWEKSTSYHISQGNQEVMMMQFTILQRLKYDSIG